MPREENTPLPQPVFSESQISPDPTVFKTAHDQKKDNELYAQVKNLQTKDVVSFDQMRGKDDDLYDLGTAFGPYGPGVVANIRKSKQINFHAAGDTGASTDTKGKYREEITVADQMAEDCHGSAAPTRPQFFYHLGDVVYNFCESPYWYDQFYEPYRNYPAPILAIPGNHDSFVIPGTKPADHPLAIFARNFCAAQPTVTREAGSLHRTAMSQPGVYFALDAPFVRILGLFSNSLEDPGVISSHSKSKPTARWPNVPDYQIAFLKAQFQRIKQEKYAGAVILAVHHPPFSYSPQKGASSGGNHGCSTDMLREIDAVCSGVGVYPHAILSGHAHNYQRYMRTIEFGSKEYEVPYVVCGDGGHNVNPIVHASKGQTPPEPKFDTDVHYLEDRPAVKSKSLRLKKYADSKTSYGYLRVNVDKDTLRIGFHQVGVSSLAQSRFDLVSINLNSHKAVPN